MHKTSLMVDRVRSSERFKILSLKAPADVISLDKGEPNFSTPPHIQEAAYKAMREDHNHYVNPQGDMELREAICSRYYSDYNAVFNPENVLVTAGGMEAISVICGAFIDPGDEVIVMNPEYSAIPEAVTLFGGVPVRVRRDDDFGLNLEAVQEMISPRTKAIIMSNPGNPTGRVLREKELEFLADLAIKHDLLLVMDEVYDKLIFANVGYQSICRLEHLRDRAILVNSFSKTYAMTGWRVGYIIAEESIIKDLLYLHLSLLLCISAPFQKACVAALLGPQDCVLEMKAAYEKRRNFLRASLKTIERLHTPECEGAFYFFPKFDHHYYSSQMIDYLVQNGVKVRSGSEFGDAGEKRIRLTFTSSMDDLEMGMERLAKAFAKLD